METLISLIVAGTVFAYLFVGLCLAVFGLGSDMDRLTAWKGSRAAKIVAAGLGVIIVTLFWPPVIAYNVGRGAAARKKAFEEKKAAFEEAKRQFTRKTAPRYYPVATPFTGLDPYEIPLTDEQLPECEGDD